MGNINVSRVLLGGLVAGVVLGVLSFLSQFIFADQMAQALERLQLTAPGGGQIAIFIVFGFVIGIVLVWLYAAIRPRFGAGIKTAAIAGVVVWLFASVLPAVNFSVLGLFPAGQMAISAVADLVAWIIAAIAGAWLYQEGPAGG